MVSWPDPKTDRADGVEGVYMERGAERRGAGGGIGYAAGAGFSAMALLGLIEGGFLLVFYRHWYPSPLRWSVSVLGHALCYGALGALAVPGAAAAAGLLIDRGTGTRDGGARKTFALGVSLFLLLFLLAGYWIKRLALPPLRDPATEAALAGIAAGSFLLAWLGGRAMSRAAPRLRARALLLAPALAGAGAVLYGLVSELRLPPAPEGRPNIVLITIDTLRGDHLPSYGYPRDTAPAFARTASRGALFLGVVAPTPFTQPSVASILTGLYPHSHGVRDHPNFLADEWTTLPEVLNYEGYATAAFVSHGLLVPEWGFGQGLRLDERTGEPARFSATLLGRTLHRLGIRRYSRNWRADAVTESALRWLESPPRRPFFLWLHYLDPHFPYDPEESYARMFDSGTGIEGLVDLAWPDGRRRIFDLPLGEKEVRKNVDLYDGEIRYTDDQIARVLDRLDALGLSEKSIVAITSDHGESLGEHGLFFAHTHYLYDPTLLVPLAIAFPPAVRPGTRVERAVRLTDLMPTLLDLAGLPVPEGTDGRSLVPLLRGDPGEPSPPLFGENGRTIVGDAEEENPRWTVEGPAGRWSMVRTDDHKLLRIPTPSGDRFELYDLRVDPRERVDRAAEDPARVDSLRALLDAWMAGEKSGSAFREKVDDETMRALRELGYIH
jgi:arylsulfatase A-like enzyme